MDETKHPDEFIAAEPNSRRIAELSRALANHRSLVDESLSPPVQVFIQSGTNINGIYLSMILVYIHRLVHEFGVLTYLS